MSLTSPKFSALIVKHVLTETKVSQSEIARWIGCDRSQICRVLSGDRGLTAVQMQKLSEESGIPLPLLVIEAQLADKKLPSEYQSFLEDSRTALTDLMGDSSES